VGGDSWRQIPGNEHALERLRVALRGGGAIAFVGAGASAELYPLWTGLIDRLACEAVSRGRADNASLDHWKRICRNYPDQAVSDIKRLLGDGIYAEVLRETFRPKARPDGCRFTRLHAALLRLRFEGYITTNFDAGLIEARLRLRPDSLATGFGTWMDEDIVYHWYTGEIFREQTCPILFAHGIYERSETVILGAVEYRSAYREGAYRRFFESLWTQRQLVLVGFGFADPWIRFLANEGLTITGARDSSGPRHIALLAMEGNETYSPQIRSLFADQYNAEPLFYRVKKGVGGNEDHTEIEAILDALGEWQGASAYMTSSDPAPASTPLQVPIREQWVHDTTEDDRFTGRHDALSKLDRWAADSEVRVVGVTGFGGLGKTSLIAHWLKNRAAHHPRQYDGLFSWSFYANRDVEAFIQRLIKFAVEQLKIPAPPKDVYPGRRALTVLRGKSVLLFLDGLEVLQEGLGNVSYGALTEDALRTLLEGACRFTHRSLLVLTSRFPFADLTSHLGGSFRNLELDSLTPKEGAELLATCDVGGTVNERQAVSRCLNGHPLGLRIFAYSLPSDVSSDPHRVVKEIFDSEGLSDADPLERKLKHLLSFYERTLPRDRVALIGLISLFRAPATEKVLLALARRLPAVAKTLNGKSDDDLRSELRAMGREHLLVRDTRSDGSEAWSCHPILRTHFRRSLLAQEWDVGPAAASLFAAQPTAGRRGLEALEPVLAAIELLLDAGEIAGADQLYRERLDNGHIFMWVALPDQGMRCAHAFVANDDRRRQCEKMLSSGRLAYYLNEVGIRAMDTGDLLFAVSFLEDALTIHRGAENKAGLSVVLQNQSRLFVLLGRLTEAVARARDALLFARDAEPEPAEVTRNALCCIGHALAELGRIGKALAAFDAANSIEQRVGRKIYSLYSLRGVHWTRLLFRIGQTERARVLTKANLNICRWNGWADDAARCECLLGSIASSERHFDDAEKHLDTAEAVLRRGRTVTELVASLLARGELELQLGRWNEAQNAVDEAMQLAATRQMRLAHADVLVLRARLRLKRIRTDASVPLPSAAERAEDDLTAALALARECGYPWAERDSLTVLAGVSDISGTADRTASLRESAGALSRRLADITPPPPDTFEPLA
jgi:tetratricopeptide (TPR) repeat protein